MEVKDLELSFSALKLEYKKEEIAKLISELPRAKAGTL